MSIEVEGQEAPEGDTLPDPAQCEHEWFPSDGAEYCAKCGVKK